MLHNIFTSTWLSAANKGRQDVFTSKGTWLLAKGFLQACWVSWLSGSTDCGLTQEHIIICQTFVSSSTVRDTALAPAGFTKMNETLFLPPSRFNSSQGNTCKQRELRAVREGKQNAMGMQHQERSVWSEKSGKASWKKWHFQQKARYRKEF